MKTEKTLINWFGLFGVISLISYTLGVIFAPSAYPGYNWMSQPITHLYRVDAPSFALWNQLASLYAIGGLVCVIMLSIAIQGKWNKLLRSGVYLMSGTLWFSSIGSALIRFSVAEGAIIFPSLAIGIFDSVIMLSIVASMILIMVGGYRGRKFVSIAVSTTVALILLFVGLISGLLLPVEYAGIAHRLVLFPLNGFIALLGLYLFMGKLNNDRSITV